MSIAPPWRPGTKAAARREAAVDMLLEGRSLAEARKENALTSVDERRVVDYLLSLAAVERRGVNGQPGPARQAVQRELNAERAERTKPVYPEPPLLPHVAAALAAFRTCVGLHPLPEQPGHQQMTWHSDTNRMARVRVLANTCEGCRVISYELCQAGGLMFIRRTDRAGARPKVAETEHLRGDLIKDLWRDLLNGQAR